MIVSAMEESTLSCTINDQGEGFGVEGHGGTSARLYGVMIAAIEEEIPEGATVKFFSQRRSGEGQRQLMFEASLVAVEGRAIYPRVRTSTGGEDLPAYTNALVAMEIDGAKALTGVKIRADLILVA